MCVHVCVRFHSVLVCACVCLLRLFFMCVHVCVRFYSCCSMCMCVFASFLVLVCACVCSLLFLFMCVHVYKFVFAYIFVYVCDHLYFFVYVFIYMCAHVYSPLYIYSRCQYKISVAYRLPTILYFKKTPSKTVPFYSAGRDVILLLTRSEYREESSLKLIFLLCLCSCCSSRLFLTRPFFFSLSIVAALLVD